MIVREISLNVPHAAVSSTVAISTTSAQSSAIAAESAYIYSTVDCFAVAGATPTATTACMFVPKETPLRIGGIKRGQKLAFITASGSGSVYLTPGA